MYTQSITTTEILTDTKHTLQVISPQQPRPRKSVTEVHKEKCVNTEVFVVSQCEVSLELALSAGLLHLNVAVVWSSNMLKGKQILVLPGFTCLTALSPESVDAEVEQRTTVHPPRPGSPTTESQGQAQFPSQKSKGEFG